jgi:hypothetical protein
MRTPLYFEHQHRGRDPVAQGSDAHGLPVDHLVQRLDVEARRASRRRHVESFSCEAPQPTFNPLLLCAGVTGPAATRHLVREADGAPRVADQQVERAAADWLRQSLGTQVRRADRVSLADDIRAAILVAGNRQRQTKGEKQPDNAEQRALQNPERLSETLREVPNAVAEENPEPRRGEEHAEEQEAQLKAREPKKEDVRPYWRARRGPRRAEARSPNIDDKRKRGWLPLCMESRSGAHRVASAATKPAASRPPTWNRVLSA